MMTNIRQMPDKTPCRGIGNDARGRSAAGPAPRSRRWLCGCLAGLMMVVSPVFADDFGPQTVLDQYFEILTTRKVEHLSMLMDSGSMTRLKGLMVDAFRNEMEQGGSSLQTRFFGKAVTMDDVQAAPASLFLNEFAREILTAAEVQRFFVDRRDVVGSLMEGEDTVHFVVRLYLHQGPRSNSDVLVYTVVREGDGWKLRFPPTIQQILTMFEARLLQ
jgi:hypothetical protein